RSIGSGLKVRGVREAVLPGVLLLEFALDANRMVIARTRLDRVAQAFTALSGSHALLVDSEGTILGANESGLIGRRVAELGAQVRASSASRQSSTVRMESEPVVGMMVVHPVVPGTLAVVSELAQRHSEAGTISWIASVFFGAMAALALWIALNRIRIRR